MDLARNPLDRIELAPLDDHEIATASGAQLVKFFDAIQSERLYAPIMLAATAGLRRGEIAGLQWGDVGDAAVTVRRARVTIGGEVVESEPKNTRRGSSRKIRTVPIPPETVAALQAWRATQLAERMSLGLGRLSDVAWVFTSEAGEALDPNRLTKAFARLWERFNPDGPALHFHSLRHTYVTLMLEAGEQPHIVQALAGHSTAGFTLSVYGHASPAAKAQAAQSLSKHLYGSG